jgi:G3E family GTPase
MLKTKVDIFSGFLGAGKTTLIKKLISEGLYREKVVIIENEFGEVPIDGALLKETKLQVKEISAGCICCSIAGDFKKAVNEVIESYSPERIIIEPSGVGKLSEIISVIEAVDMRSKLELDMVITVVDVIRFNMYVNNFGEFYKNQIINAKTIVLSRTQGFGEDKLLNIQGEINRINSKVNIVTTPWEKLSGKKIVELSKKKLSVNEEVNLIKRPGFGAAMRASKDIGNKEIFETYGLETPKKFNLNSLKNNVGNINEKNMYGNILSAKGIVQIDSGEWIQFDFVPGEFQARKTSPDYSGRLCIIGTELNKENLKKLFSL